MTSTGERETATFPENPFTSLLPAFCHCDFVHNNEDQIDGVETRYYYQRIASAPSVWAAKRINIRWSNDTKAAVLLMLRHLGPLVGAALAACSSSSSSDDDDCNSHNYYIRSYMLDAVHQLGHGPEWDGIFHPKFDKLVTYIAGLAIQHGLLVVGDNATACWTVEFSGGLDGARRWLEAVRTRPGPGPGPGEREEVGTTGGVSVAATTAPSTPTITQTQEKN